MRHIKVKALVEAEFYTNYEEDDAESPEVRESNEQDEASEQAGLYVGILRNLAGIPDEYEGALNINTLGWTVTFLEKEIDDDLSGSLG